VLFKSNAAILISRFHVAKDIDDCYFESFGRPRQPAAPIATKPRPFKSRGPLWNGSEALEDWQRKGGGLAGAMPHRSRPPSTGGVAWN